LRWRVTQEERMEFRSTMQRARKRRWIWCLGGRTSSRCFRKRLSHHNEFDRFLERLLRKQPDSLRCVVVVMHAVRWQNTIPWVTYLRRESGVSSGCAKSCQYFPTHRVRRREGPSREGHSISIIGYAGRPSSTRVRTMEVGPEELFSIFA
jgi:hypothetical protein